VIAVLGLALGLAACAGEEPVVADAADGGGVADGPADAAADAGSADAAADGGADADDGGTGADAGLDAGGGDDATVDGGADAGPGCGPDGTVCSAGGDMVCVGDACVARGCGDGWREPGPVPAREGCDDGNAAGGDACAADCTPTLLTVAARPGEEDRPAGPRVTVAADDGGAVLVVWQASAGAEGAAVMAQRFSRGGVAVGTPIVVDPAIFAGWDAAPTVVGVGAGWLVAWTSPDLAADGAGAAAAVARVEPDGSLGPRLSLAATTVGDQRLPVLGRVPGQGVVAAWIDGSPGGGLTRVRARRVGDDGVPVGNELGWSDGGGAGRHDAPALVADAGGVVAAWSFSAGGTATAVVHLRRFGATLAPLDATPLVASDPGAGGAEPALARRGDGRAVLAWTTRATDARGDVRWRLVEASGAALVAPSQPLAAMPAFPESMPALAPSGAGVLALVHRGSMLSDLPRDLVVVALDATAPPELVALAPLLAGSGRQSDGSLAAVAGALWVVWADDAAVAVPAVSTLAFLLPESQP
jgi:cysteine-rich repeat protein